MLFSYASKKKPVLQGYTLLFETRDSLVEETYLLPAKSEQLAKMEQQLAHCATPLEKRESFISNGGLLMNTLDKQEGRQRPALIEFTKSGIIKSCLSYEHGILTVYGKNPYNICAFNFANEFNFGKKSKVGSSVFTVSSISTLPTKPIEHRSNLVKEVTSFEMRKYLFDRNLPLTNYLKHLTPTQEGPVAGYCSQKESNHCNSCYRLEYLGS